MLDKEALQMVVDLVEQRENCLESIYTIIDKLDTGAASWKTAAVTFDFMRRRRTEAAFDL